MKRVVLPFVVLLLAACDARVTPSAPSVVAAETPGVSVAAGAAVVVSPPPVAVVEPAVPIAASDPTNPNCTELDPKKWVGFTYRVQLTFVQMWNGSTCDRVVTWRAFNVISDTNQPALGNAVIVTVPAGRMDFRIDVHFFNGEPPCGTVIQTDGRSGSVPNMLHMNASFPPGVLFPQPACRVVPPPPPPTCVEPGFGPWKPALITKRPFQCSRESRERIACSGERQLEFREVCQ